MKSISGSSHTCEWGVTVAYPNGLSPFMLAIRPPSIIRFCPLVWPAPFATFFARVCAIASGTCHVQPIGPKPVPSSFHRFGKSNEYSPVPIGSDVRAPESKMLGQTDRQTHKHSPANFFYRPTRGNLRAKRLQC